MRVLWRLIIVRGQIRGICIGQSFRRPHSRRRIGARLVALGRVRVQSLRIRAANVERGVVKQRVHDRVIEVQSRGERGEFGQRCHRALVRGLAKGLIRGEITVRIVPA